MTKPNVWIDTASDDNIYWEADGKKDEEGYGEVLLTLTIPGLHPIPVVVTHGRGSSGWGGGWSFGLDLPEGSTLERRE